MNLWTMFCRFWLWPVVALCVLYFAMMVWPGNKWESIEQDVVKLAHSAITADGFNNDTISITQNGRDLLVSGTIQSEEEKNRLISIIEAAVDDGDRVAPRVVDWDGIIALNKQTQPSESDMAGNGTLQIDIDATTVVLSGTLSSQRAIDDLMTAAINTYVGRTINNQLSIGENIKPIANVNAFVTHFNIGEGSLSVNDNELVLTGNVERSELKEKLEKQLLLALGSGYTLNNKIAIVVPNVAKTIAAEPTADELMAAMPEENRICQEQLVKVMDETNIYFATNKADIKPNSVNTLNAIASVLLACPEAVIEVGGHTDSVGEDALNLALSQRRAESVLDFLVSKAEIKNEIVAVGYGETKPVADNSTRSGQANNRRIQFIVR